MNDTHKPIEDITGKYTLDIIASANRFNAWVYKEFKNYLRGEILELGSGTGNIAQFPVKDNLTITLSDVNSEYCEILTKKFSPYSNVRNIFLIDMQDASFKQKHISLKEKFDTVFLLNVVEHIEDDKQTIENCNFLLKAGGTLIVLVPAYQFLYCKLDKNLGHFKRYTLKKVKKLFAINNFTITASKHLNLLGIAGWFVFGKIFHLGRLGKSEMSTFDFMVPVAKLLDKIVFNKAGLSIIVIGEKK